MSSRVTSTASINAACAASWVGVGNCAASACPALTRNLPWRVHAGARHAPTSLDDPGPLLTPVAAAALHDRPEGMAWFATPAPSGTGVIARAHTEAHDGGRLLPGHLAASDLVELQAMVPPGLTFDPTLTVESPPGCLGWWWD